MVAAALDRVIDKLESWIILLFYPSIVRNQYSPTFIKWLLLSLLGLDCQIQANGGNPAGAVEWSHQMIDC